MLQIQYTVSQKRRHFNAPVSLGDSTGLESVEIASQSEAEEEQKKLVVKMELEVGVQAAGDTKEIACQTDRLVTCV